MNQIHEAAKNEWIKHICNLLVPIIKEGFRNIYTNCVIAAGASGGAEQTPRILESFQQTLKDIPNWNGDIINIEYNRILDSDTNCRDILDDLIEAAFKSHILVLSTAANKKVEIDIPNSRRFIHKVYIESARVFYQNPHLFYGMSYDDGPEYEYRYHKNNAKIDSVLCSSVATSIQKLMPMKLILQSYLAPEDEAEFGDDVDDVEDITRRMSPRSTRGLKSVLKTYIKSTGNVINQEEPKDILAVEEQEDHKQEKYYTSGSDYSDDYSDYDDRDHGGERRDRHRDEEERKEDDRDNRKDHRDDRYYDEDSSRSDDDIIQINSYTSKETKEKLHHMAHTSPMRKEDHHRHHHRGNRRKYDREYEDDRVRSPMKTPKGHHSRSKSIEFRIDHDQDEIYPTKKKSTKKVRYGPAEKNVKLVKKNDTKKRARAPTPSRSKK